MPYGQNDQRYPHLPLAREEASFERRKRPYFPKRPDRGDRIRFGEQLESALKNIENQARQMPLPAKGIKPHLVFRVPVNARTNAANVTEVLEKAGLTVVSV